jgi:hypothetical protein
MELVAFAGKDRENWGQISALVSRGEWSKVVIVKNKAVENYENPLDAKVIAINCDKPLVELKKEMMEKLKQELGELEVALSIASGNGKEHMALISALLSLPVGIRLAAFTKEGVEFVN